MEDQGQGLLEFGTSVTVNEDLRRTILNEAHKIQEAIDKLNQDLKKEQDSNKKLQNSKSKVVREADDMREKSEILREKLSFMHGVLEDLYNTTLRSELKMPLESSTNASNESDEDINSNLDNNDNDKNDDDHQNVNCPASDETTLLVGSVTPMTMRTICQQEHFLSQKLWALDEALKEVEDSALVLAREKKKVAERKYEAEMRLHETRVQLSEIQTASDSLKCTLQSEEESQRQLEAQLCDVKASKDKVLKDLKELEKSREKSEKESFQKEKEAAAKVAKLEETVRGQTAQLHSTKTEYEMLLARLEILNSEYTEYCAWKAEYESQQIARELARKDRGTLCSLEKEMEAEWAAKNSEYELSVQESARLAKKLEKFTLEAKAAEMRIQERYDEIRQMTKEKEELETLLSRVDDNESPTKAVEVAEMELEECQAELRLMLKQLKDADEATEKEKRLLAEETENQVSHSKKLCSDREKLEQEVANLQEKLKLATESRAHEALQAERHLFVLQYGVQMIELAKEKEKRYLTKKP